MTKRLERLLSFLAHNPKDAFTLYAVGLEYKSIEDYKSAVSYLKKCIEIDSTYVAAYYQLAEIMILVSDKQAAKKYIQQGLELCSKINDTKTQSEFNALLYELEV